MAQIPNTKKFNIYDVKNTLVRESMDAESLRKTFEGFPNAPNAPSVPDVHNACPPMPNSSMRLYEN